MMVSVRMPNFRGSIDEFVSSFQKLNLYGYYVYTRVVEVVFRNPLRIWPSDELRKLLEDLRVDAIIGLNIMESYGIHIENDEIKFKHALK
jgi:hypothetical protein